MDKSLVSSLFKNIYRYIFCFSRRKHKTPEILNIIDKDADGETNADDF